MSNDQLNQFKQQLQEWKTSIEQEIQTEIEIIINQPEQEQEEADEADIASTKNIIDFQEKRHEKYQYFLKEINHALNKIANRSYGICEETEEPIDVKRLKANPIARYSIEAQILMEQQG